MTRINPDRFHELCRRKNDRKASLDEASKALCAANSACHEARAKFEEASRNLNAYILECTGDVPAPSRASRQRSKR